MLHNSIAQKQDESKSLTLLSHGFINKSAEVKTGLNNFQKELIMQTKSNKKFSLNSMQIEKLGEFSNTFRELGDSSALLSQIAIKSGANPKLWSKINLAGQGLMSFGGGLAKVAEAKSIISLASCTGSLSLVFGGLTVADALFNDATDNDNGLGEALQEIGDALNIIMQQMQELYNCMHEIKNIICENMAITMFHLSQIKNQINRLENVMCSSFKELHLKNFIDIFDAIKNDIKGDYLLEDEVRKKLLGELRTWIDYHSKSPLQTFSLRDSQEPSKLVELLSHNDFDSAIMLSIIASQLQRLIPSKFLDALNIEDLPNIALLNVAVEFYTTAIVEYGFKDNYQPLLQRTVDNLLTVKQYILNISNQKEIYEILFKQYTYFRQQVGLAIFECRADFPSNTSPETPLSNLLKNNINQEKLLMFLDQLEMRRLLIKHLCCLNKNLSYWQTYLELESRESILGKTKQTLDAASVSVISNASRGKLEHFIHDLDNGANPNAWDSWGQIIHYLCLRYQFDNHEWNNFSNAPLLLHKLFKSGKILQSSNGSLTNWPPTWGANVAPIRMISNLGFFDSAVLWCANGFDIELHFNYFYNGLLYSNNHNWNYIVQKYLIADINNAKGVLNKADLQKAYQFYHSIEAGEYPSSENINHDCILWLVAILGNLDVIQAIPNFNPSINKAIPIANFTPLMMAVYCGKENVVEYLLKKGANVKAGLTVRDPGSTDWHPSYVPTEDHALGQNAQPHLLYIAILRKQFSIAKKLVGAGLTPNATQRSQLADGYQTTHVITQHPVRIENFPSASVPSNDRTLSLIDETLSRLTEAMTLLSDRRNIQQSVSSVQTIDAQNDDPFNYDLAELNESCRFYLETLLQLNTIPEHLQKIVSDIALLEQFQSNEARIDNVLKNISTNFNKADTLLKMKLNSEYTLSNNISELIKDIGEFRGKYNVKLHKFSTHRNALFSPSTNSMPGIVQSPQPILSLSRR